MRRKKQQTKINETYSCDVNFIFIYRKTVWDIENIHILCIYIILNLKLLQLICAHCIWIGGYKWLLLKVILSSICEECNLNTHSKLISIHRIWLNYCWIWLLIWIVCCFLLVHRFTPVSVRMVVFFVFCYFHRKFSNLLQYYVCKIQKCS